MLRACPRLSGIAPVPALPVEGHEVALVRPLLLGFYSLEALGGLLVVFGVSRTLGHRLIIVVRAGVHGLVDPR